MESSKTRPKAATSSNAGKIKNKTKEVFRSIKENKVVKVVGYMLTAVAGLFALGGLFRVVAWTLQGWNQLTVALRK